jgi:hypothetical protein
MSRYRVFIDKKPQSVLHDSLQDAAESVDRTLLQNGAKVYIHDREGDFFKWSKVTESAVLSGIEIMPVNEAERMKDWY